MLAGQHDSFEHGVTNIYRRESRGWKILHHHPDLSPAMQDLRYRMQPPPGEANLSVPERMWKDDAILTYPAESDGL
jgi:hypothetical protein